MLRYMTIILGTLVTVTAAFPGISYASTIASAPQKDSNLTFLFAAYTITWLVFFGYIYIIARRQRNLARDIKELQLRLKELDNNNSQ